MILSGCAHLELDASVDRPRPSSVVFDQRFAFPDTDGRTCGSGSIPNDSQFIHNGLSALQPELLIIGIVTAIIGVAFDDNGHIATFFQPLRGEIDLTLAQVGQVTQSRN